MSTTAPKTRPKRRRATVAALALLAALAAGTWAGDRLRSVPSVAPALARAQQPVATSFRALTPDVRPCLGRFVRHEAPHTTDGGREPRQFESNGSGLAVGDLDDDGDLDLAMGGLAGDDSILWNEGGLHFRRQPLVGGGSRAVIVADVDGDGGLDVLFARHTLPPQLHRNLGGGRFGKLSLPGFELKAYSLALGDPDGDGDLDAVGGSYDAGLEKDLGYNFMFTHSGGGVMYYERTDAGEYVGRRLAEGAEALALLLTDLDNDGAPELLTGNDFGLPDYAHTWRDGDWAAYSPFRHTSHSTMSLDSGDVDNDGVLEVYSTDMKPIARDVATLARWRPVMVRTPVDTFRGDKQIMENVLQVRTRGGAYANAAYDRVVDATGWSWSGKFGDLDSDGLLDLYVVNGMIAADLFGHLPGGELVEANQAMKNAGDGGFRRAPEWGLGSLSSGRAMSMADLDNDGDLDVVVNNLEQPAEIFENRLCGGVGLQVELRQPDTRNTRALGSTVRLHTDKGVLTREVRASSGYLSGDAARLHFGLPKGAVVERVEILWPDGKGSSVARPQTGGVLVVRR